jgi:SpoVK/Ycf46/Vps4 family AAA+-type ATPase
MQIDSLPSYVLTVAATNHAELLDRAVWRRFQLKISFPAPQTEQVATFIERIIASWPEQPKISAGEIATSLGATSYAEARDFCQNVRRRQILGLGEVEINSALFSELRFWEARVKPENIYGDRSDKAIAETKRRRTSKTKSGTRRRIT